MCKKGSSNHRYVGFILVKWLLKFHGYCCVNAKCHLKNALKKKRRQKKSSNLTPAVVAQAHFTPRSDSALDVRWNNCLWLSQLWKLWDKRPPSFCKNRCSFCCPELKKNCTCSNPFSVRTSGDLLKMEIIIFPDCQHLTKPKSLGTQLFGEWGNILVKEPFYCKR